VKTDSRGNFQWDQYYGGAMFDGGSSVVQTDDIGFLLLGWTRSFGASQKDFYLVKTDSLGNEQWHRIYGGSGEDVAQHIMQLQDSNYLFSGGSDYKGRLFKIDSAGNVIWQKNYQYPTGSGGNFLFSAMELNDRSILAVGLTNNAWENDAGWLIKTDEAGNLLWQRKYNKNSNSDLFYSVLQTNDNGFLLGGQAYNTAINTTNAWLLKVDSIGCPYANCTVGIDETEKTVVVDIWPNPANEVLNLELQEPHVKTTIELMDISGKLVYHSEETNLSKTQIDVSGLASGVYLLKVVLHKAVVTKKILVEH